jgi:tRNA modification GTPase
MPFLLTDTAGLRASDDVIETIGVERAQARMSDADIVLWLGPPEQVPDRGRTLSVEPKADEIVPGARSRNVDVHVSALTGEGMGELIDLLLESGRQLLPRDGEVALNARQRVLVAASLVHLHEAGEASDPLVAAEELRQARHALDRLTGRAGVEDMLDSLFGKMCIGK